jgi:hypothetical protein
MRRDNSRPSKIEFEIVENQLVLPFLFINLGDKYGYL